MRLVEPLVSCVVPVYNGAAFLSETLNSIVEQTYRELEIIVVDDGSVDETPAIAARFGSNLRYVRQNRGGLAAARNLGVSLCRGSLVAFLDADDVWHPMKIERQVLEFERQPDLDACFTLVRNVWETSAEPERERLRRDGRVKLIHPFVTCSFLGRKKLFDLLGVFNPLIPTDEDADFFRRFRAHRVPFSVIPEVLVRRRLHGGNMSWGDAIVDIDEILLRASSARRRVKDAASYVAALDVEARHASNADAQYLRVAGRGVIVRFGTEMLESRLMPALNHLHNPDAVGEFSFVVFDLVAAGLSRPDFTSRAFQTAVRSHFQDPEAIAFIHRHSLSIFLPSQSLAIYVLDDERDIPFPERGTPLSPIFRLWARRHGLLLVHAAAIGTVADGVLILGASGAGKSTTALSGLATQLYYVSDDYCIVDTKFPITAYCLYSSGKLRRGSDLTRDVSAGLGVTEVLHDAEKEVHFLYPSHAERIVDRLRIRALLVPEIGAPSTAPPFPVSRASALCALAPSTLFQWADPKSSDFHELASVARNLPAYRFPIGKDFLRIGPVLEALLANLTDESGIRFQTGCSATSSFRCEEATDQSFHTR